MESAINTHLVSWGLEDKDNSSASFEIDGKSCTDVRIEQEKEWMHGVSGLKTMQHNI